MIETNWLAIFSLFTLFFIIDLYCIFYSLVGFTTPTDADRICRYATKFQKSAALFIGWLFLELGANSFTVFALVTMEIFESFVTLFATYAILFARNRFTKHKWSRDWKKVCRILEVRYSRKLAYARKAHQLFD